MDMLRKTAILLLLSGLARATHPQQLRPPQAPDHSDVTESLQLPPAEVPTAITPTTDEREGLIHLDVAARDKEGKSFGNLAVTDLTLLQDGAATKILSFHGSNA